MSGGRKKLRRAIVSLACLQLWLAHLAVADVASAPDRHGVGAAASDAPANGHIQNSIDRSSGAGKAPPEDAELEAWLDEETEPAVPQAGAGELVFLSPPPGSRTLHSINTLRVTRSSLVDGWVNIRQCYEGLDAVPAAEVVYQYDNMRNLRIHSKANIGKAVTREQTVQLTDVGQDAMLCIQAEAQILYPRSNESFVLRNGPFHRRFLDGYFPLHISMDVQFPAALLDYVEISPRAQPGFDVAVQGEHVYIDTCFAGTLHIELAFSRRQSGP